MMMSQRSPLRMSSNTITAMLSLVIDISMHGCQSNHSFVEGSHCTQLSSLGCCRTHESGAAVQTLIVGWAYDRSPHSF